MGNEKDRIDIVVKAFYMENAQPAGWDKPFEWKPNVSLVFKKIDKSFQEIGEELRARTNGADNLWMFGEMGGKNSKGHFFDIMTESGSNPKPWTSFVPVAELFKDGSMKRIQAPAGAKETTVQQPLAPKAPVSASTPGPTAPAKPSEPIKAPPGTDKFLHQALFQPQSDPWWRMKENFNVDGMIVSKSFDLAVAALGYIQKGKEQAAAYQEDVIVWAGWFENVLREEKFARACDRFRSMLEMAVLEDEVKAVMALAWGSLPLSHYELVKVAGLKRFKDIKDGVAVAGALPTPEAPGAEEGEDHGKGSEEDIPF